MVTAKSPGGWNMKQTIESFIERVKVESNIHKFIQEALIYKLITNFRKNYVKMNYPKKINNPLDIVLKFYKNYNKEYYEKNKTKLNKIQREYYEKNIHIFIWRKLLKRTLYKN